MLIWSVGPVVKRNGSPGRQVKVTAMPLGS
jgi:hypothetical protein